MRKAYISCLVAGVALALIAWPRPTSAAPSRSVHFGASRSQPRPRTVCCNGGGYNRTAAVSYADSYVYPYNSYWPSFASGEGDCTNFVSQSLYAGGQIMLGNYYSDPTNDNYWFMILNPNVAWHWSHSWTVSGDLWQYTWNQSLGYQVGTYSGMTYNGTDGLSIGDYLLYNLYGTGINHSTFQVVWNGVDPNSTLAGSLIDSHTSNRWHAIWTLWPYNANKSTTTIYTIHEYD